MLSSASSPVVTTGATVGAPTETNSATLKMQNPRGTEFLSSHTDYSNITVNNKDAIALTSTENVSINNIGDQRHIDSRNDTDVGNILSSNSESHRSPSERLVAY